MQYKILLSANILELENIIQEYLNNGWKLKGNLFQLNKSISDPHLIYQVVTKDDISADEQKCYEEMRKQAFKTLYDDFKKSHSKAAEESYFNKLKTDLFSSESNRDQ